jgi:hypothetical protein
MKNTSKSLRLTERDVEYISGSPVGVTCGVSGELPATEWVVRDSNPNRGYVLTWSTYRCNRS